MSFAWVFQSSPTQSRSRAQIARTMRRFPLRSSGRPSSLAGSPASRLCQSSTCCSASSAETGLRGVGEARLATGRDQQTVRRLDGGLAAGRRPAQGRPPPNPTRGDRHQTGPGPEDRLVGDPGARRHRWRGRAEDGPCTPDVALVVHQAGQRAGVRGRVAAQQGAGGSFDDRAGRLVAEDQPVTEMEDPGVDHDDRRRPARAPGRGRLARQRQGMEHERKLTHGREDAGGRELDLGALGDGEHQPAPSGRPEARGYRDRLPCLGRVERGVGGSERLLLAGAGIGGRGLLLVDGLLETVLEAVVDVHDRPLPLRRSYDRRTAAPCHELASGEGHGHRHEVAGPDQVHADRAGRVGRVSSGPGGDERQDVGPQLIDQTPPG